MGMYYCKGCSELKNDDWHPMSENELCPDCEADHEENISERLGQINKQHQEWVKGLGNKS